MTALLAGGGGNVYEGAGAVPVRPHAHARAVSVDRAYDVIPATIEIPARPESHGEQRTALE